MGLTNSEMWAVKVVELQCRLCPNEQSAKQYEFETDHQQNQANDLFKSSTCLIAKQRTKNYQTLRATPAVNSQLESYCSSVYTLQHSRPTANNSSGSAGLLPTHRQ